MTRRPARPLLNLVAALVVAGGLLLLGAAGAGPLPPLGPAFNPGTGVWTAAADAGLPRDATLRVTGLDKPVRVTFEANGTAHVVASTDHDLFWTVGYMHARFRLFQMDLERRQGEGLLSEVVGLAALDSDRFELRLGLARTARAEWDALPRDSPGRLALTAYAQGVNQRIDEDGRTGALPLLFKMLGYRPCPWTPLDSLAVQGDLTQTLDFTDAPLDYALLVHALGYARTMRWFPILPPNAQRPYDPGPYASHAPASIESQANANAAGVSASEARAVAALKGGLAALPPSALHHGSNSNNWAVDGTKTASGKPLLAGDPHLSQTLPAVWYQLTADAPDYHFSGVSVPGVPVILIGRNRRIAWSLTNTQNQATLFYVERTDRARPGQYYWRGAWRRMRRASYTIPVKGHDPVRLTVDLTVHGPAMTDDRAPGQTVAVDWIGALPSEDIDTILGIIRSSTFGEFRDALRAWHAPSQNFVYADDRGNIGLVSAGYYPIVKGGRPWLPLSGTGENDVVGTIPFADVPQVYNPPGHIVFSANQREVGPGYPYYIGTTMDFFDPGYRADRIYEVLHGRGHLTSADMERLQNDTHDGLARLIVPRLLDALRGKGLTAREARARALLQGWDGDMAVDSPAAYIWATFWSRYLYDTFQPWWNAYSVPYKKFQELSVDASIGQAPVSLGQDLEAWTLHDPANGAFSPPHGARRTAADVMARAFGDAVAAGTRALGGDPGAWRWGRVHARAFESLAQIASLGYGPRPSGGDPWTVDAADGGYTSRAGPSWRFVMDWGAGPSGRAVGVYPGGQSENPVSPWYKNEIEAWWDGKYVPMLDAASARARAGAATWTLIS